MSKSKKKERENMKIWRNYDIMKEFKWTTLKSFIISYLKQISVRNNEIWIKHHILRRRSSFKGINDLSILKEKKFTIFQCLNYLVLYRSIIIQGFVIIKKKKIVES